MKTSLTRWHIWRGVSTTILNYMLTDLIKNLRIIQLYANFILSSLRHLIKKSQDHYEEQ